MKLQPVEEFEGLPVRPHPCRPPFERLESVADRLGGVREILDVPIDLVTVRPVTLHSDEREIVLLDESGRQPRTPAVVLRGAVRSFPQQHVFSISELLDETIQIGGLFQSVCRRVDIVDGRVDVVQFGPRRAILECHTSPRSASSTMSSRWLTFSLSWSW